MVTNLKNLIQEANMAKINANHLKSSFSGPNPAKRGIVFNFSDQTPTKNSGQQKNISLKQQPKFKHIQDADRILQKKPQPQNSTEQASAIQNPKSKNARCNNLTEIAYQRSISLTSDNDQFLSGYKPPNSQQTNTQVQSSLKVQEQSGYTRNRMQALDGLCKYTVPKTVFPIHSNSTRLAHTYDLEDPKNKEAPQNMLFVQPQKKTHQGNFQIQLPKDSKIMKMNTADRGGFSPQVPQPVDLPQKTDLAKQPQNQIRGDFPTATNSQSKSIAQQLSPGQVPSNHKNFGNGSIRRLELSRYHKGAQNQTSKKLDIFEKFRVYKKVSPGSFDLFEAQDFLNKTHQNYRIVTRDSFHLNRIQTPLQDSSAIWSKGYHTERQQEPDQEERM